MCLSLQNSPQMISNQLSIFLCFEKCSQKTNFDRLKSRGTHPFDRFIWLWNTKSRKAWKITVKLINRLRETFSWSINFHFKLNINWFLDCFQCYTETNTLFAASIYKYYTFFIDIDRRVLYIKAANNLRLVIIIKNTSFGLKSSSTGSLTKLKSVFLTKQIASRFSQHWRGKSRKRTLVSCHGHQTRCQGPFSNVSFQFWEDRLTNCLFKKRPQQSRDENWTAYPVS